MNLVSKERTRRSEMYTTRSLCYVVLTGLIKTIDMTKNDTCDASSPKTKTNTQTNIDFQDRRYFRQMISRLRVRQRVYAEWTVPKTVRNTLRSFRLDENVFTEKHTPKPRKLDGNRNENRLVYQGVARETGTFEQKQSIRLRGHRMETRARLSSRTTRKVHVTFSNPQTTLHTLSVPKRVPCSYTSRPNFGITEINIAIIVYIYCRRVYTFVRVRRNRSNRLRSIRVVTRRSRDVASRTTVCEADRNALV